MIALLPDRVVWLNVCPSSAAYTRGSSSSSGVVADVLCLVFGSVRMSLSISSSFSILTKFESIFMRWLLFLGITLSLSFNNV